MSHRTTSVSKRYEDTPQEVGNTIGSRSLNENVNTKFTFQLIFSGNYIINFSRENIYAH